MLDLSLRYSTELSTLCLPCSVPASRIKVCPHRYGEKDLEWTASANWTFRRSFSLDRAFLQHTHADLVLDGVDTVADVLLNGKLAGSTVSAFRCSSTCWGATRSASDAAIKSPSLWQPLYAMSACTIRMTAVHSHCNSLDCDVW